MRAFRICMQNIRKWRANKRVIMCICFALLFTYYYTDGLRMLSDSLGLKMSPWIFPFLITFRYIKILFMAIVIFIFCDAPFIDSNQSYVVLRSGRRAWNTGQILYVFAGSFIYCIILLAGTILLNIRHISWSNVWGKVLGVAATDVGKLDALGKYYTTIRVPAIVVRYYSPAQAMFFAFLLMWLSYIFIGLLIYVLNIVTNTQVAGALVAGFLVLLTAFVDGAPLFNRFSPISWNSLNNIDVGGLTAYPRITYVLGAYVVMIVLLIAITYVVLPKKEIIVRQEQ